MDPLPLGLPPHEQLGILAGAFQHDVANHASVLSGLVQLLETTPPPGRDGARLFAELQRALGRFNEALAEFTRMRRALTQPTPRCAPAEAAAAIRTAPGGGTLAATVAPDDPSLSGDARWFGFLVATLSGIAGQPPKQIAFTARGAEPPACAELRLHFGKIEPGPLAGFASKVPPTPLSPELAVARIILVRLDGTAELVSGEAGLLLRLRFRHPRPLPR